MQKHEPLNAQAHCATTDWNILKWHEMTCLELQVAYCCNEHIPFGKPQLFMTELQIEPSRPWYSLGYCTGSRIHITCTSPKWGCQNLPLPETNQWGPSFSTGFGKDLGTSCDWYEDNKRQCPKNGRRLAGFNLFKSSSQINNIGYFKGYLDHSWSSTYSSFLG